jgi:hypothetical protein
MYAIVYLITNNFLKNYIDREEINSIFRVTHDGTAITSLQSLTI